MLLSHQSASLVSRPRTCTPARAAARAGDLQQPSDAAARCTKLLAGTSVFVVGDNSKANAALASSLAALLGYAPLHTAELLQQLTGQTFQQIEESEGADSAALAEAQILEQTCTLGRVVVSTVGGGHGAAARGDCWRHMFGGVSIWLDESSAADADAPQREAYALSELTVQAGALDLLVGLQLAERSLPGLETLLGSDSKLVGKKSLYVRLGARGDWPDLAAPGELPDRAASK